MGELFRSQEMRRIRLYFQIEAAHDTVDELGELGLVQFRDLNPDVNLFQRNFVAEVKRADEMERKLRFFEEQIVQDGLKDQVVPAADVQLLQEEGSSSPSKEQTAALEMDELESKLEDLEKELLQLNGNQQMLKRNYNELLELKHVLLKDAEFFQQQAIGDRIGDEDIEDDVESPLIRNEGGIQMHGVKLGFITGVIERKKVNSFERVLWRATRGNLFMRQTEIEELLIDPNKGETVEKSVFIVFFQGERAEAKIKKICETLEANLYPCPQSANERAELLNQVDTRIDDLDLVMERSEEHRRRVLLDIAAKIEAWKVKVVKEKSIYHTMNLFNYDVGRKCLIAEGWCPATAVESIRDALKRANDRSGALVPAIVQELKPKQQPPTYFPTNKFTKAFQGIVDSYGMARYREVNPGVFTIVTFPFLFGLMFGDVGHGLLMFLFAAYLVAKEDKLAKSGLNEMVQMCFNGRYLLLLMSIAAIYCGFIYNEVFALPLDLFGSRWEYHGNNEEATWTKPAIAYPFGVDPAWKGASNELTYYNSLKMKMSIIFGVAHMCFGIFLSLLNGIHFRKPYNILFEFIPQMCFMLSIFGYMCFLIFLKWTIKFVERGKTAPYLLNVMIEMFLSPFSLKDENNLFAGQLYVQWVLIVVAFVSVPLMLLPKPLLLRRDHKKQMGYRAIRDAEQGGGEGGHHDAGEESDDEEEEFDFSEVFIHQIIHTIEFVLGAISNTASYLRLWALSLAHSELATVFWDRVMVTTMTKFGGSFVLVFGGFAIWAAFTVGVLLLMESLSAFLHALRLHWVEFQNKFYAGDGYKFVPFSYQRILSGEEED